MCKYTHLPPIPHVDTAAMDFLARIKNLQATLEGQSCPAYVLTVKAVKLVGTGTGDDS